MEGANESGRAAVNALLETAGSKAEPVQMYKLYDPPGVRGGEAGRRPALRPGPAERARQTGMKVAESSNKQDAPEFGSISSA